MLKCVAVFLLPPQQFSYYCGKAQCPFGYKSYHLVPHRFRQLMVGGVVEDVWIDEHTQSYGHEIGHVVL